MSNGMKIKSKLFIAFLLIGLAPLILMTFMGLKKAFSTSQLVMIMVIVIGVVAFLAQCQITLTLGDLFEHRRHAQRDRPGSR